MSYWSDRAREYEQDWQNRVQAELEVELAKYFEESLEEIERDIAALYGRFIFGGQQPLPIFHYSEAKRLIRGKEYKKWRMTLEEYVALSHSSSKILRELNTLAMRSRISRLEKLYSETLMHLQNLGERYEGAVKDFLTTAYKDRYSRGIYDLAKVGKLEIPVSKVEPAKLEKVLAQKWSGGNYSSRVWSNTEKLSRAIKSAVTQGLHRGLSVQKLSSELSREMKSSYKNAERLVRTELNFVQNMAAKESLEAAGLEEYEFIAVLDHRTTPRCQELDGTYHLLEEYSPGTNAPPMHPRCRSTISAVVEGGKRVAKSKGRNIRVPAEMKYKDYKEIYIEKKIEKADYKMLAGFIGSLDNVTVRKWYIYHDEHIHERIDDALPLEEKARLAFELRNEYRTQARELMADKAAREELDSKYPNKTFEGLIADKMRRKNMTRAEALEDIYNTAQKSNREVNKKLGLIK